MNKPTSISYQDMLWCLLGFFVLITGILLTQNIELSKGNVENKAEYVIIMEWENSSDSDVDLWVRSPQGNLIFYRQKDKDLITLDRDDMGISSDTILDSNGNRILQPYRREITSIRALTPGEIVVNVVLFAMRDASKDVKVRVQIIKLNPYGTVLEREVVLTQRGMEQTIATFRIKDDGSFGNLTYDYVPLVRTAPR